MTGIVKTDQIQGAQSSTITIPSGNKISIADSATVGTLNATTMSGTPTFSGGIANTGTVSAGTLGSSVTFPAGHIIQTVSVKVNTQTTTTSASYQNTDLTLAITPTSSSNKILINFSIPMFQATANCHALVGLYRGDNTGTLLTQNFGLGGVYGGGNSSGGGISGAGLLDSPNTTNSTTYTVCHASINGGTSYAMINNGTGILTLQEIAQ